MILSTYDPNGQASCPTCKKLQKVYITGGLLIGLDRYMDAQCLTCETRFRVHLDRNSAFGNHSADDRPSVEILKEGSGGLIVR
jgi:hypothetical protein